MHRPTLVDSLFAIIHDRIASGHYPKGGQLPTELELINEFNTSRTTVRAAIDRLVSKNMVIRKHGVGTFVANTEHIINPIDEFIDFQELIRNNGLEPCYHNHETKLIDITDQIAQHLDVQNDRKVLKISKFWTANQRPIVFCDNYFPLWIFSPGQADKIISGEVSTEPVINFFHDCINHDITNYVAALECNIMSNCAFGPFKRHFAPDTPLLIIRQTGTDKQGSRIHHSIEYHPDNIMKFAVNRAVTLMQ